MTKGETDPRVNEHTEFASTPPAMTVLSDQALSHKEAYLEGFDLSYRVGPVYDILRHPETRTPMAIAIYGTWGTGKTSAMKWLHGLLDVWNEKGKDEEKDKVRVWPVWFYPWKYHTKEDVWRGLVAEVIIESISVSKPTIGKVTKAAKQFGIFLGRSFVHVLAGLELEGKVPAGGPGAKLSLAGIKEVLEEYREAAHPEAGYLNEFETSLREWVNETLGKNERMVIFIDDLDRCMPEVALQVLEALKLYLNIEKLIFVVGVDREVVDKLVAEHYRKLGLDPEKSLQYLAKMFQVEVPLEPSVGQIEKFLAEQLDRIESWKKLSELQQEVFRTVTLELAGRNPREVKRLLNSASIAGAGARMMKQEKDQSLLPIEQGMQLFFVRKILTDRHTYGSLVGLPLGDKFFGEWSRIVRNNEGVGDFKRSIKLPSSLMKRTAEKGAEPEAVAERAGKRRTGEEVGDEPDLSSVPEAYRDLVRNPAFSSLLHLLGDPELGELMRIEYPSDTSAIAVATGSALPEGMIREAIARQVGKKPEDLTDEEFAKLTELDLSGLKISDLEPLRVLANLRGLDLSGTQVSDLEPLRGLGTLTLLCLVDTQVSNDQVSALLKALPKLEIFR